MIPRSGVSGIVIHGSGRHFSSGADLEDIARALREGPDHTRRSQGNDVPAMLVDNLRSFSFFDGLDMPVAAAITGVCLGSALELALFCHCRICGAGAVLGLPESTFGLIPGCGGIQKLMSVAGLPRAMELILSGDTFTAEEALGWHIVDRIVPKEETVAAAVNFIRAIGGGYRRDKIGAYIHRYMSYKG